MALYTEKVLLQLVLCKYNLYRAKQCNVTNATTHKLTHFIFENFA